MPFGKHKGQPVENMPPQYLEWLASNTDLREPLRSAVWRALGADMVPVGLDTDRVKATYRAVSLKWHPDRGGSHEAMQAVNEFYTMLTEATWA